MFIGTRLTTAKDGSYRTWDFVTSSNVRLAWIGPALRELGMPPQELKKYPQPNVKN